MTLPLITAVGIIQAVIFSRIDLLGARPDLMLLLVIGWAAVRGIREGLIWGAIGGLICDVLSGGPLGAMSVALVVAAFLAGQPWGQGLGSPVLQFWILASVGITAYHLLLLLLMGYTGYPVDWGYDLLYVALPSIVLNTALFPFLRGPLSWLEDRIVQQGVRL